MLGSLITLVLLAACSFWLFRVQPTPLKPFFWPALILKWVSGLLVGWLYFNYYGDGDTVTYWKDGGLVASAMVADPVGTLRFMWDDSASDLVFILHNSTPRSIFFVKIAGFLSLITGGYYGMMSLILSWFSFFGAWFLFRVMNDSYPNHRLASAFAFLFFPSVVFWSSGLIKESLGLASVFIIVALVLIWVSERKYTHWFWLLPLALWLGWNLKYYWMGILVPVVITVVGVNLLEEWKPVLKKYELLIWAGLFVLILWGGTQLHPNFYPQRFAEVIVQSNAEFMAISTAGHAAVFPNLSPSFSSILYHAPMALWTGLFRPFITESYNGVSALVASENILLLLLTLTALPSMLTALKCSHRLMVLACLVYVILLAIFLALSTPNFGTLSRYRIGFLPFMVFLIVVENPFIKWVLSKWRSKP